MVAYNIPICVHVELDRATVVTLAREGTIVGLKDSSGDDATFRDMLLDLKGTKVWAMTGAELVVDNALLMGAQGAVPGLGNIDPAAFARLYDADPPRRLGNRAQGAGADLPAQGHRPLRHAARQLGRLDLQRLQGGAAWRWA